MMCTVRASRRRRGRHGGGGAVRAGRRGTACILCVMDEDARERGGAREAGDAAGRRLYQAGLDLRGRACLVVGGGGVALRKAEGLVEAGADGPRRRAGVPADARGRRRHAAAVRRRRPRGRHARGGRQRRPRAQRARGRARPRARRVGERRGRAGRGRPGAAGRGAPRRAAHRRLDRRRESRPWRGASASGWTQSSAPNGASSRSCSDALRAEWEPRAIAAGVPPAARRAAWHELLDLPLAELLAAGQAGEAEAQARAVLERVLAEAGRRS